MILSCKESLGIDRRSDYLLKVFIAYMAESLRVKIDKRFIRITGLPEHNENEIYPLLKKKLVPRDELESLGVFLKNRGNKIVFTSGVFDMLHIGHARYLQLAKSLGDVLIVGVNADISVKKLKGPNRPILDERKRSEMLSFLAMVDYMTLYDENTGAETMKLLKPDSYLCVEGSWKGNIATKEEIVTMARLGGTSYYAPSQGPTISTTDIIATISKQAGEKLLNEFTKMVNEGMGFRDE